MGCSLSTLGREKPVTARCRDREHSIKLCVQHEHAFAAAHAAYIRSLKNTGAAIRQFGEGGDTIKADVEVSHGLELVLDTPESTKRHDDLTYGKPYFPPPRPHFLTPSFISRISSIQPLHSFSSPRALALARALSFTSPRNSFTYESTDGETEARKHIYVQPPPPLPIQILTPPPAPPVMKSSQWDLYNVFPPEGNPTLDIFKEDQNCHKEDHATGFKTSHMSQRSLETEETSLLEKADSEVPASPTKMKARISDVEFSRALKELDDNFLLAYESGRDISRLLEGQRTHYYSSFASPNESLNHSSRMLRVMSWERRTQFASAKEKAVAVEATYGDDSKETHASTLDKLLAWEKKLHEEVKAGEVIRIKLERKSVELKRQRKREKSPRLTKRKAVVKKLQNRYLVEVQAVDAASSEVEKLRDDCLHAQLVDLVQKSMTMWQAMLKCHQQQSQLIEEMQLLDSSCAPSSSNDLHIKNTLQLESEINTWHQNLEMLIATQKEYLKSVHHWLQLHVTEIKSDGEKLMASPETAINPPVYALCRAWLTAVDQVPDDVPLQALKAFADTIHKLRLQQAEELKQKRKLEQLKQELGRKEQALKAQESKYKESQLSQFELLEKEEPSETKEVKVRRDPWKEKEASVKLFREKVECESEKYDLLCTKSGNMTLSSLQEGLPPVLDAMREFARTCLQRYTELFVRVVSTEEEEASNVLQITY